MVARACVHRRLHRFPQIFEDHLKHIDEVLHIFPKAGVTTMLKKSHLHIKRIDYLGHVIVLGKLKVAQKTTETVEAS